MAFAFGLILTDFTFCCCFSGMCYYSCEICLSCVSETKQADKILIACSFSLRPRPCVYLSVLRKTTSETYQHDTYFYFAFHFSYVQVH